MSKKQKMDQLTGGTGDVNKQTMYFDHIIASDTINKTTVSAAIPLPLATFLPNIPPSLVPVMEVLSVDSMVDNRSVISVDVGGASGRGWVFSLSASPQNFVSGSTGGHIFNPPSPDTLYYEKSLAMNVAYTGAGVTVESTGAGTIPGSASGVDCTDGSGHGVIVFGNQLFSNFAFIAGAASPNISQQVTITWTICWRLKYITLQEFVANNNFTGRAISSS